MVRLLAGLLRRLAPACAGVSETILSFIIIQQYGEKSNGV